MITKSEVNVAILGAMVTGTVAAVGKELALLAMFSNGIHIALANPKLAKRLAVSAEIIVRGSPMSSEQSGLLTEATTDLDDLRR